MTTTATARDTDASGWRSPSRLVVAVGLLVITLVSVTAGADPDLWGHVRFGQDILAAGHVVKVDPYSFTSDREWVNHEWLAEVTMALAWNLGGTLGLVTLKALLVLGTLALVAWAARRAGVPSLAAWLLVVLAAVGIVPRATVVRPQLFSLLLFAVQLVILAEHEQRLRRSPLLGLPLLYALWANLHGGWLIGGGVLALWAGGHTLEGRLPRADRLLLVGVGALSLGATLINPYGVGMWRFLADTVGLGRPHIADWQPIWRAPAPLVSWAVVFALAFLIIRERCPPRWTHALVIASLGLMSVKVNRVDAFFALSAALLLLPPLSTAIRRIGDRERAVPKQQSVPLLLAVVAYAVLGVGWVHQVAVQATCIPIDAKDEYPEPEAAAFVREAALSGNVVNFFNHGQYLIWHVTPALKVSMDGRRETVYSEAVLDAHAQFYNSPATAAAYPETLGADIVWLPNSRGAGPYLEQRGWVPVFNGPVTTVLARHATVVTRSTSARPVTRCFPGP